MNDRPIEVLCPKGHLHPVVRYAIEGGKVGYKGACDEAGLYFEVQTIPIEEARELEFTDECKTCGRPGLHKHDARWCCTGIVCCPDRAEEFERWGKPPA